MKKNILLITIISLVHFGCSYNFSDDNFSGINKPSTENNAIIINDFQSGDVINIERLMTYTLKGTSNAYGAESIVYLNNEKIGAGWNAQNETGSFKLYPERYEDGIHTLRFEHSFNSGTGSLADQLSLEVLTKVEVFQFVVNRKTSSPPQITDAIVENGSVTLKWTNLIDTDFEKAFLSIKFKNFENRVPLTEEILKSKHFIDKTTVLHSGSSNSPNYDHYSKATYSILLTNEYTDNYGISKSIEYDHAWFEPQISFNNLKSYTLSWPAHPFYNNFENLQISAQPGLILGASSGGEIVINESFVFGETYTTGIRPSANNINHEYFWYRDTKLSEDTFGQFDFNDLSSVGIVYNPYNEKFYAAIYEGYVSQSEGYKLFIYEYSKDMELIQKKFITNGIYSNRHQALYVDSKTQNFYLDTFNNSYLIDKDNFSILKQVTGSLDDTRKIFRRDIVVTQSGYFPTQTSIESFKTNEILYSGDSVGSTISNNGAYIYIEDENGKAIYEINEDQLSKVIDVNEYISQLIDYNGIIIYSHSDKFSILDTATMNIKTFDFSYQKSMQFDPISNKLLLIINGYAGIFDLDTNNLETFTFENNKFVGPGNSYFMYLQNGRLFHSKGIYVDNF